MIYNLRNRRYWKSWIRRDIRKLLYKILYGFNMGGFSGTHHPKVGKGKFVSVYQKGKIIQLINENDGGEIRIIPYQPNHGIFVECIKDGKVTSRDILSYSQLKHKEFHKIKK